MKAKIFETTQIARIREAIGKGGHVVLQGRPKDARRKDSRFKLRVYYDKSQDITESVMHEQPYRHYLGFYTKDVDPDDLREDIADMIVHKYGAAV